MGIFNWSAYRSESSYLALHVFIFSFLKTALKRLKPNQKLCYFILMILRIPLKVNEAACKLQIIGFILVGIVN